MIEVKSLSQIPVGELEEVVRRIAEMDEEAAPLWKRALEDHALRAKINPDGYHVAFENDRVVGASYAITTNGLPTAEQMLRAEEMGSIAHLHEKGGNTFYFHMLRVAKKWRGRGVDKRLIESQLNNANAQGFSAVHFIAEEFQRNYYKHRIKATRTGTTCDFGGVRHEWWIKHI